MFNMICRTFDRPPMRRAAQHARRCAATMRACDDLRCFSFFTLIITSLRLPPAHTPSPIAATLRRHAIIFFFQRMPPLASSLCRFVASDIAIRLHCRYADCLPLARAAFVSLFDAEMLFAFPDLRHAATMSLRCHLLLMLAAFGCCHAG